MKHPSTIILIFLLFNVAKLLADEKQQRVRVDSAYTYRILDETTEINRKQLVLLQMKASGLLKNRQMYFGADMNVIADVQDTNTPTKFGYLMRHPTAKNHGGSSVSELVIHGTQLQVTGTINPWATMYFQLLYNPEQSFGQGTITDINRNQLSLRRGYVLLGDLNKFPIYASIGKMAIPFGLTDTVNPFTASTVWHAFGGLSYGGLAGYQQGGLNLSFMAIQGGAQFRAANSGDATPDDIANFSVNGSYDFRPSSNQLFRIGAGYLKGSAYCNSFPVKHFEDCKGFNNPAWGVHTLVNIGRFTFLAEFAKTLDVWPGTHNPNAPLNIFGAEKVSAFDVGLKYTASIKPLNKDIGISVDFSQFNAGPIESPWENQDQFVVGLEMLWGKNLKCFAEYIRTDGYVPLNFISGPDPLDPNKALGTTHSSSETKSNVFLVGLRMAI